MNDKVVLITGATSGIGKETALELAQRGANIVIVARNADKLKQVIAETKAASGNDRIDSIIADLSLMQSVREAAKQFRTKYSRLDILINNAGGYFSPRKVTSEGNEYTFAANYLGHFLLTNLLLDLIKKSAPARIINVSSQAQQMGHIDFDDLNSTKGYKAMKAYAQSKLANILFTYELAKRLADIGVTVNALHPGVVGTNFSKDAGGITGFFFSLMKPLLLTPAEGARTSIYLATSPNVEKITGTYFAKSKPIRSNKESYNPEVSKRLWEVSEKIVGLK